MRKVLVVSAGIVLVGLLIAACSTPAPTPQTIEKQVTVVVQQTVVVTAPAPTAAPAQPAPTAVPPTAAPAPANAQVIIVPVAANATKDKNVFTATVKLMTDTVAGPYNAVIAMGASGLSNVPVNVPVHIQCTSDNPKNPGKVAWSLNEPAASKAKLLDPAAVVTQFTPDVAGMYQAVCSLGGSGEAGAVQLHAGTYLGNDAENCKTCHGDTVAEWAKTGHAKIFSDNIDNKRTPAVATHYTESCASCHTVGYYAAPYGVDGGGFKDVMTKANWQFPTWDKINAAGKGGASNFNAMPAAVKNMANIQCEQCHGPATDHVKNGQPIMDASMDEGVCNVCHNGSSKHDKGEQLKNAAHSNKDAAAFNTPVGPAEQACVRCHSGYGYASFLDNPTNPAAWDNRKQTIVCATCHDPHSDANPFQLRIMSKPVAVPFEVKKDIGLSATCFECHNSRTNADEFVKGTPGFGIPHYSSIAEMISGVAGVTYGQTLPDSPHGQMVGAAPIPNPAFAKDPTLNQFLFSNVGDTKGNIPGPCVTCHMWPIISDATDPNFEKVGGHSFNMVSPDGKFDYTGACAQCHGDLKDFNFKAPADYDGNGKVEGVQDEVKGLLDQLWKAMEAKGVKKVGTGYPYATLPTGADGKVDPKINSAWYNFRTVYGVMWGTDTGDGNQGKAQTIHNFKRSVALLQASLKDLTGSLPAGMTEMK